MRYGVCGETLGNYARTIEHIVGSIVLQHTEVMRSK